MSQVTNLAFFRARRGQSEALGAALAALVEPPRLEAGCLNYDLHRSVDDADVWFVYENWRSPEGFDAHMLSEHLKAFLKATPDLVAGNAPHLNATSISNSNRNTPMLFSGKNIIVTGATGDLGVANVQRLISQGANVLAVAGHQSEISRLATFSGPGTLETSVADVSDAEQVLGYATRAFALWGQIDGFVNNAGIQTSANRSPFKRAEFGSPIRMAVSALFIAAGIATASPVFAGTERGSQNMADTSDAALAASLPGDFRNGYAEVNGTRIHYVEGGKGTPVLLLPGWPQTWWEFHKIMPELAKRHRVIAVDLRGMGGSAKPGLGYDKKNMAKDIHELTQALGYKQVNIAGHDIGAMVAYSFAANYPDATLKICLIDVAHPEESLYTLSLLPPPGHAVRGTGESTHPVYLWWFAFNQLPDLPQQLLAGKSRLLIDWLFDSQLRNPAAISERDRAIYAAAYSQPDAIRAGNGWYQTFGQDIIDAKHYGQIATPVLALAGERNYPYLRELLPTQASDVRVVKVNSSSHYVPEDQPEAVVRELLGFFKS